MSLSCDCGYDYDDPDWWYSSTLKFSTLATKRGRKCCSCGAPIKPGDDMVEFTRWRGPKDDIEERIYGECGEISLASWHMCETCGGLAMAVEESGMCFSIGENIKTQIADYRAEENAQRKTP
jgi:hypothetical protein